MTQTTDEVPIPRSPHDKVLEPLKQEWQSVRFGHIIVHPCPVNQDTLNVTSASGTGCEGNSRTLARVVVCERESRFAVILEVPGFPSMRLYGPECKRNKVIWRDTGGSVWADTWDAELLTTARDATHWLKERSFEVHFDVAIEGLLDAGRTDSSRTVALCIATKNRLWQLHRALPLNLLHSWPHQSWAKIHIVDLDSTDGTLQWILDHCHAAVDVGLLHVYRAPDMPYWHASIGKNAAHMVATEDILVNVDSDNLIGPGFAGDVVRHFNEGYTALQYEDGEGTCGRIACYRTDFYDLRGYDEDCYPMGAQDVDLVLRLKARPNARFRKVRGSFFSQAIPNTQEQKTMMCDPKYGNLRWGRMDAINRAAFGCRRQGGQFVRNLHKEQIGVKVVKVAPL